jgi:hypothetical protein
MKNVVLAIAAALVLIALPAVAQYTDPATATQPSTTTTTTTTTPSSSMDTSAPATDTTTSSVPVQEERTNPQVPTHGPSSGLTASGSVVSWNADEVVLRTALLLTTRPVRRKLSIGSSSSGSAIDEPVAGSLVATESPRAKGRLKRRPRESG